jgi:hypothetical protein
LKALDFYGKNSAWSGGGGYFLNNESYVLSGIEPLHEVRQTSGMKVMRRRNTFLISEETEPDFSYTWDESPGISPPDSWHDHVWSKSIDAEWSLIKIPLPHERHSNYLLMHQKTEEKIPCTDWTWADMDGSRLVFTQAGKLFTAHPADILAGTPHLLYDFNDMKFEERVAPY